MKKWTKSCLCAMAIIATITLPAWCTVTSLVKPSSSDGSKNTSPLNGAIQKSSTGYIMITTPSSTSSWTESNSYFIQWNSIGTSGYVNIYYYQGGSWYYSIAYDVSTSGYYYWTIPASLKSGYYQIYIYDYNNNSIYAFSEPFYISGFLPSITVTSPTSSSSWTAGNSYYIDWTSIGTSGSVYIEYYSSGSYHSIAYNVYDSGSYYWSVPSTLSSGYYEIYIYDASNSTIAGYSSSFYITSSNPFNRYVPGFDVAFTVLGFLVGALGVIAFALKKHQLRK